MSEENKGPQVNGEFIVQDLCEQIAIISKERAIAVAANRQLQEYTKNLEANVKELQEKLEKLEERFEKSKTAGPVPVKKENTKANS